MILLYGFAFALAIVFVDVAVRYRTLVELQSKDLGLYAVSVIAEALLWTLVVAGTWAVARRRPRAAWGVVGFVSLLYGFIVVGAYSFNTYFGVMPNLFTFEYLYEELGDSWANVSGTTPFGTLVGIVLSAAIVAVYLRNPWAERFAHRAHKILLAVVGLLFVATLPVLHNNVRLYPNAFPPGSQVTFSWSKATENAARGHTRDIRILNAANRAPLETRLGTPPFRVLLILNESLRAQSLHAFGHERDTTPNLDAFLRERADRTAAFHRAYGNSTRTMIAVPSFLTGISPIQRGADLFTAPLVFDYAKLFDDVATFIVSAHSFDWANVIDFVKGPSLDHIWHKDNAGVPELNPQAIDDSYVVAEFERYIEALPEGQSFLGVVHLRGTHVPYFTSEEDTIWEPKTVQDRYDNSVRYLDRNVQKILDLLEERGWLDDTLVIASADHAEALGEHGYQGHLHTFFDVEARVPLWIHLPTAAIGDCPSLADNTRTPISNIDVVPTLLDLMNIDDQPEIQARTTNLLGRSLCRPIPADRAVLMQNHNDVSARHMFGGLGVVLGKHKYLLRVEGRRAWEELYDLEADPGETKDLWPQVDESLRRRIYDQVVEERNSRFVWERYVGPDADAQGR